MRSRVSGGRRIWGWRAGLAWVALIVGAAPGFARGEGTPPSADPIVLAADWIRHWEQNGVRWVLLEQRGSILQGTEGLRAHRVLARVTTRREGEATVHVVEAYAEGDARFAHELDARAGRLRMTRLSSTGVRIQGLGGAQPQESPPPGQPPELMVRGFPADLEPEQPVVGKAAQPADVAPEGPGEPAEPPPVDAAVTRAQFTPGTGTIAPPPVTPPSGGEELLEPLQPFGGAAEMPDVGEEGEDVPGGTIEELVPGTELPAGEGRPGAPAAPEAPIMPGTRRVISVFPKNSGGLFATDAKIEPDGRATIYLRGGVNIVAEDATQGIVDITADNAVIWTRYPESGGPTSGTVNRMDLDPRQPIEIYLEGNVVFRQDAREVAGAGDRKVVEAESFYIDLRNQWFLADAARLNLYDARFITPIRTLGQTIQQYRPYLGNGANGPMYGPVQIRADRTLVTGSRFPVPGYRFRSRSVDLTEVSTPLMGPDGKPLADASNPLAPRDKVWQIDARQNAFFVGPVPVFYWPRLVTESDDLDPPLRQFQFRANNYFGQQLLTDWTAFKLLGVQRPPWVDLWNIDVDYLSARGLALGTELGWSGRDLRDNLVDPFSRRRDGWEIDRPYFGYFDAWGLRENRGVDTLGTGPAVITNGPPGAGKAGFQRDAAPSYQDFRGRLTLRHMQFFVPSDADIDQDMRLQLEGNLLSDRFFLEQYYKNLFDAGLDQKNLAYFINQNENRAFTVLASGNFQSFFTDTQFFPRLQYSRFGDTFFNDWLSWSHTYGVDYANVHTDVMVNNPNIFAFQPFDPTSATSGPFRTGRAWTAQELSLPLNLDLLRVVPYAQGQLVGWDNQYATSLPDLELAPTLPDQAFIRGPQGSRLGRAWGAGGIRANMMAWRNFMGVESELLNLHGLRHKINFDVDYRYAVSNVGVNRIGVQDELDDNTYEFVRRYFALINYKGGVLPAQYDPRLLTLRRQVSPIAGTTDLQDNMNTLNLGLHQRWQTKRGPEGRRRVVDVMALDLTTTYFPQAQRDNFGKPFGQNMYNWEYYIGDRASLVSFGWFEMFDITGDPILISNPRGTNDPFGMSVITTGISLNRPPRGNIFMGYSVINTGPIATSAVNVACSYWLSPKWYSSFGTSYDFGNAILLGSTFGITRIGADFLTSVGLTIDPQRNSYMFGFELTPRLSPSMRFGSGGGIARVDSRFAATQ